MEVSTVPGDVPVNDDFKDVVVLVLVDEGEDVVGF